MALAPGTRLGPYEIVSSIGAGGMGEVYRARDSRLGRDVAIKVLPTGLSDDPGRLRRFELEARSTGQLNHPNILALYDVGTHGGAPYVVTELLEGETLAGRLLGGRLAPRTAVEVGVQVALGLAAAHEKGIVHRDLKPANLFLTRDGVVKILDFGLARHFEGPSGREEMSKLSTQEQGTEAGAVLGTVGYMSPEQARGQPVDHRTDIFAFGCVLYEMLAGSRAFRGETPSDTLAAILVRDPDPLPAGTPPGLAFIVRQCLEKRPEDRISSARDVALALQAASTSGGTAPDHRRPAGWTGRRRLAVAAVAALVVLAAALLALDVGGLRPKWLGRGSAAPSIRSLAVLPLTNLSGDAAQEYFSDGMTEELITRLSRVSALKVISRTSVMRYKDTRKALKEIAAELGVDGIVEGSVLRSGERVRITAQLIDASTDAHLWAESYERDLKDVLSLQGEVARTIAGAVNVALTPQERERLSRARPVDPEAYEAYLKGTYNWMKMTPQGVDASRGYFERALEKDPSYASAYQGLAWSWLVGQQMGITAPSEAGPKAKAAALRAIALDDTCAEAHEALAAVRAWTDWDWAGAEPEWRRTFELDPNSSNAHAYYAHFLAILGRTKEAVPHSERAVERDPSNALFHAMYAMVLVYDRRYDDALAAADAALAIQPDMSVARSARQGVYIVRGMREEQLAEQRERIAKDPGRVAAFEKGLAEGGYEGAQRAIADLLAARYEKAGGVPNAGKLRVYMPCAIAMRYRDARDYERAIDWLEKAYDVRDPALPYQLASPVNDPLRGSARFQALVRRMNLPVAGAR